MKSVETSISLRFQTPDGEVKLTGDNLNPELSAINYTTGQEAPLAGFVALPPAVTYNLTFSDGRRGLYRDDGDIYLGGKIVSIAEVIRLIAELSPGPSKDFYRHLSDGERLVILTENPGLRLDLNGVVNYTGNRISDQPDPYSAGCLLPIGDLFRDYVNLPSNRTDGAESLMINNNWEMTSGDTVDVVGFKRRGDKSDTLVPWSDFIHKGNNDDFMSPSSSDLIKSNYLTTPVFERLEYLRGFFDTNYVDIILEGGLRPVEQEIEVSLPYYGRIKFIRDIMFSLGIGSKLTSMHAGRNKSQYGLQPKCSLREFSGLFNRVEKAERLMAAAEKEDPQRQNAIYLRSVEMIQPAAEGFNIIAQDHQQIVYLGTNFLPRVSHTR